MECQGEGKVLGRVVGFCLVSGISALPAVISVEFFFDAGKLHLSRQICSVYEAATSNSASS